MTIFLLKNNVKLSEAEFGWLPLKLY